MRHRADGGVCHSSASKERLRSNPHTTDRDSHRCCRLSRDTPGSERHTVPTHAGGGGQGALPPRPPEIYRRRANLGEQKQKRDAQGIPSPILAPESALGSRLRVSLSSAQVTDYFIRALTAEPLLVRADPPDNTVRFLVGCPLSEDCGTAETRPPTDVSGVQPTAPRALYAILGGRFSKLALFFEKNPSPCQSTAAQCLASRAAPTASSITNPKPKHFHEAS
jgi:hypothetical protein